MATAASAIWRIRTGGNALNGAGYDSTTYPGGSDYSQQDAAQLSLGDIACSNNTTLTSSTGGFTSAMVGNAMWIPAAGGATAGYYWISACGDTNTVTLDRTPGTVSGGSCKVGGAASNIVDLYNKVVAGNIVYIKPTAGNASTYPTTGFDYTMASKYTPTVGSTTAGPVKWIGDGGIPTISAPGCAFYNTTIQHFYNLYFFASGTTNGSSGVLGGSGIYVKDCIINLNSQAAVVGLSSYTNGLFFNSEVTGVGAVTGSTAAPSYSSGSNGVIVNGVNCYVINCNLHHCRGYGIADGGSSGSQIVSCRIWKGASHGIYLSGSIGSLPKIANCTIDANMGSGVYINVANNLQNIFIYNNSITNQVQSSVYGIYCNSTTTSFDDFIKRLCDYNNVYNNTTNYGNLSAGASDISVDPGYNSASTGDFTPSNSAMQAGVP